MSLRLTKSGSIMLLAACIAATISSGCSSSKDDAELAKLKSEQEALKQDVRELRSDLGKPNEKK